MKNLVLVRLCILLGLFGSFQFSWAGDRNNDGYYKRFKDRLSDALPHLNDVEKQIEQHECTDCYKLIPDLLFDVLNRKSFCGVVLPPTDIDVLDLLDESNESKASPYVERYLAEVYGDGTDDCSKARDYWFQRIAGWRGILGNCNLSNFHIEWSRDKTPLLSVAVLTGFCAISLYQS
jgi:hypothetical protein